MSRADPALGLAARLQALADGAEACAGRVDADAVSAAAAVVERAGRRLALSGEATVVALAGATGSGKSSLFNALSGTDLAVVGVRRPTTSQPLACSWGASAAEDLLDWLQVPRRHALTSGDADRLDGLVLLDLPDHDSTELSHRMEVDRLVELVDSFVWVVDPQKYADAALHDRYLKPLAQHAEVMTVVLNQVDRLAADERDRCVRDLRRLLGDEGLGRVNVLAVSTVTGEGLPQLRQQISRQVAEKRTAARRLAADVSVVAARLSDASGTVAAAEVGREARAAITDRLSAAAGVGVVTEAVGRAWRLRGAYATGWPVLSWLAKFRPDPLRRLHLGRLATGRRRRELEAAPESRTSLPATTTVHRAQSDSALRSFADQASAGLARGWADAVRAAARGNADRLPDALDRAVARTNLDVERHRRWWVVVRVVQWLLVATVVAGLGWLGSAFVLAYLRLPPLPEVTWFELPAPTVLVVGGIAAGLLLAALSRVGVAVGARRRARQAGKALRHAIAGVADELVIAPVAAERTRYEAARTALARARG